MLNGAATIKHTNTSSFLDAHWTSFFKYEDILVNPFHCRLLQGYKHWIPSYTLSPFKSRCKKTMPLITPGWAAMQLHCHKNNGGGLLMLTRDIISFVDNTAALPQLAVPHLQQQGILIQCPIANNCTSTFCHWAVAALVTTHGSRTSSASTKCRFLLGILIHITPDGTWIQTKTKEANN